MTTDELKALFEKHDNEYIEFGRIKDPPTLRPDLCAFLLLDKLCPEKPRYKGGGLDIVTAARYDEFWVSVTPEELAAVASEDDIVTLIRCGLRLNTDTDSFAFFT